MKAPLAALLATLATLSTPLDTWAGGEIVIDRSAYHDRLRGFWLGSSIANWTGLPTENTRAIPPFFTDDDWQMQIGRDGEIVDYVLESAPWGSDDDTDIEYVYQSALEKNASYILTDKQIASAWQKHIGLPLLWVSNLAALGQMQNGALPPETSLPHNNPMWDMIDAQLTTEIFGALSPARPDVALQTAHLPIRTTAYLHSEWAAEFYVIMHSLVPLVDPQWSRAEQVIWMAQEARKRIPNGSYIADMYDFVKAQYDANADKDDWEQTRDKVYERYQVKRAAGYNYKYPWDAGINFASSIVSLLYGEGDYKKTIRIGALAGWDADNPTATWGGMLGLLYGYAGLEEHFDKRDFSDEYFISRTRYNFPAAADNFTDMASRGLKVIDRVVVHGMGGRLVAGNWLIPPMQGDIETATTQEMRVPWETIEDNDPRWEYTGFVTSEEQWNASGATLTSGQSDCLAEINFTGTAVQYYAFRNADAGTVKVILDNMEPRFVDLSNKADPDTQHLGQNPKFRSQQYYVKVFEQRGLPRGDHRLRIACDSKSTHKNIDMLSIIP
ncbi:MAG: ADP-ribosylglycohydrolase family protein [Congregibacter sp.]